MVDVAVEESLLVRPHLRACESFVDIKASLRKLRHIASFDELTAHLVNELHCVYHLSDSTKVQSVSYSTTDAPNLFVHEFDRHTFDMLHAHDEAVSDVASMTIDVEAAMGALAEIVEAKPPVFANSREKDKYMNAENQREREQRAKLREVRSRAAMKRDEMLALYRKIKHVLLLDSFRVFTLSPNVNELWS